MRTHSRLTKLYLGASLLVISGFGSILAGNILGSANNNTVEFGAGQYFIKSCNSWIGLNLIPGTTGSDGAPAGMSPLIGVELSGLDSKKCGSTRLTIRSESKVQKAIPLVHTDGQDSLCSHGTCAQGQRVSDSFSLDINAQGEVTLEGQDQNRSLSYDSKQKVYVIQFLKPAAIAAEVQNFIIQSEDLRN